MVKTAIISGGFTGVVEGTVNKATTITNGVKNYCSSNSNRGGYEN